MKQLLPILLLFTLSTVLCGCPYDSPYNLDEEPLENVEEGLIGKWTTTISKPAANEQTKDEPVEIIIGKRTDREYDIAITGNISELKPYQLVTEDSIKGTAYTSTLAGKRFLNAYIHGKVYLSELIIANDSVSIMPLAEYFTSKLIKNSRELRTAVEFHYRMRQRPGYDHLFALRNLQKIN